MVFPFFLPFLILFPFYWPRATKVQTEKAKNFGHFTSGNSLLTLASLLYYWKRTILPLLLLFPPFGPRLSFYFLKGPFRHSYYQDLLPGCSKVWTEGGLRFPRRKNLNFSLIEGPGLPKGGGIGWLRNYQFPLPWGRIPFFGRNLLTRG